MARRPVAQALVVAAACLLLTTSVPPAPVRAAGAITVTSLADAQGADGFCTLREALIAAANDAVFVPGVGECPAGSGVDTITFASGGTISLTAPLFSPSVVDIDGGTDGVAAGGPERVTIDGDGTFPLLMAGGGTFRHLRFTDGHSSGDGGAIMATGPLVVEDATFRGNSAPAFGGAIDAVADLTLTRTTFDTNSAGFGGAVANEPGMDLVITDSTFTANAALQQAGAIVAQGNLTISGSTFDGNAAAAGPGALIVLGGTTGISNSQFTNNTGTFGGAMMIIGGDLGSNTSIINTSFTGNSASGAGAGDGGAIFATPGAAVSLTDSVVTDNAASSGGGGIATLADLSVADSTIHGNTAGTTGGGIDAKGDGLGTIALTAATVDGNSAPSGGGLSVLGQTLLLTSSSVTNNAATGTPTSVVTYPGIGGGVIVLAGGTMSGTMCTISGNDADVDGGGLDLQNSIATLTTCTVAGNQVASGAGGGVNVASDASLTLRRSTISGNTANNGGGVYSLGSLDLANVTVHGNWAPGGGGAMMGKGGGIQSGGTATISNATIAMNGSATMDGAGIEVAAGTTTLRNTIVVGNEAGMPGGAKTQSEVTVAFGATLSPSSTSNVLAIPVGKTVLDILDADGLADNGGPTRTVGIAATSPARDAGDATVCVSAAVGAVDQRGRVRSGACDIGAVEEEAVAPVVGTPTAALRTGIRLGTGVPVHLAWTGADDNGGSGVDHFEVRRSVNGGAWVVVAAARPTPDADLAVTSGAVTRFQVRAVDRDGNVSAWSTAVTATGLLVQQSATAVTYQGTWTRSLGTGYSGGSVAWSQARGAAAAFTFTGRQVALVATRATTRGKVKLYVDGVYRATVDLGTSGGSRSVVWSYGWGASGRHTVKVVGLGTAGRPRVDVDAFVILR